MADAQASLTTWVNSIVHGVNDSEKYLAISKIVQSATTDDIAMLVASQLRVVSINAQCPTKAQRQHLHIFDDRSFASLVPLIEMMDSVSKPPGK